MRNSKNEVDLENTNIFLPEVHLNNKSSTLDKKMLKLVSIRLFLGYLRLFAFMKVKITQIKKST